SGAAALLLAVFLAGARNVRTLASRTGSAAAVLKLPRHDAVQDIGARLDAEYGVVELDIARRLAVEFLDLDLHDQDSLPSPASGLSPSAALVPPCTARVVSSPAPACCSLSSSS